MAETMMQQQYRRDARMLGEIGALLAHADLPLVTVRLPRHLAHAAVDAWNLDDEGEPDSETYEQRITRHRAAALALIGLAVEERGREVDDEVVVDLSPDLVGKALDAADDLPT